MGELLFVRHTETACTLAGRFCGDCETELTDDGLDAARQLGARWRGPVLALRTAPARRARQTAEALAAALAVPCAVDERLAETRFGAWEGRSPAEVDGTAEYRAWVQDPVLYAPPGGEAGVEVLARALAAVRDMLATWPGGRVAVVSHKHVIRLLVAYAAGLPLRRYRSDVPLPPGAVVTLVGGPDGLRVTGP